MECSLPSRVYTINPAYEDEAMRYDMLLSYFFCVLLLLELLLGKLVLLLGSSVRICNDKVQEC